MHKRFLILLICLPLLEVQLASADDFGFTGKHQRFFRLYDPSLSDIAFSYAFEPAIEADAGPGEADLHRFGARFELPYPTSEDSYFRYGAEYALRSYDLEPVPGARTNDSSLNLHTVQLSFGAGYFIADNLLITGVARPAIFSDFEDDVDEDDFQLHGEGLLVYQINPGTQILGGGRYSEEFDDTPLLPFGGIRLLSESGKLHISLTVPLEGRIGYNLSPETELFAGVWASGDKFSVAMGEEPVNFNVQIQERRLGGGFTHWLSEHFAVTVEAGATLESTLEFKVDNPGQFQDEDVSPAGYVSVELGASL